jgi:hypothetical protein
MDAIDFKTGQGPRVGCISKEIFGNNMTSLIQDILYSRE